MCLNCCKNFFSQRLILIYILSLILMYEICKHIQTCRNKAILSRRIANQRVRAMGAWEEEEQGCIYCKKVSLPPPHLALYVTWHYRRELMVLGPLSRTSPLLLAFLCTIRSWRWGYIQLHTLLPSTFLNFCWFLVDELGFIGDANSSSSLIVFIF